MNIMNVMKCIMAGPHVEMLAPPFRNTFETHLNAAGCMIPRIRQGNEWNPVIRDSAISDALAEKLMADNVSKEMS